MATPTASATPKHSRFWAEMKSFGIIAGYLYVCFLVLEVYRASILAEHDVQSLTLGVALVKALIIGKFILIGEAIKVGERISARTLLHRIVWKTAAFWLMLILFNFLEELITGWFHHKATADILNEMLGRSPVELLAPSLVMLLILIPLIWLTEVNRALGKGVLRGLMLSVDGAEAKK